MAQHFQQQSLAQWLEIIAKVDNEGIVTSKFHHRIKIDHWTTMLFWNNTIFNRRKKTEEVLKTTRIFIYLFTFL